MSPSFILAPELSLIVHGTLMIESAETKVRTDRDPFIDAIISMARGVDADPQMVKNAAYSTPVREIGHVTSARKPVMRWNG